jgi:hypothetical protein
LHFFGGFIRKSHAKNSRRLGAVANEVGNPKRDHASFARAGARQDQHRARKSIDCFFLWWVKSGHRIETSVKETSVKWGPHFDPDLASCDSACRVFD